jgi:uncharacterized membrane protein YccC
LGKKNGRKSGRLCFLSGLSSLVMAFLIAPDKQSSKLDYFLLHFVNEEAKTIAVLCEEFPAEKRFTQLDRVAKVYQTHNALKNVNVFISKRSLSKL